MPDPNGFPALTIPLSIFSLFRADVLPAYAGLPGQELIPYFLALLTFAGAALVAVVQWPLSAMWRRLARFRNGRKDVVKNTPISADAPDSPSEDNHDKP